MFGHTIQIMKNIVSITVFGLILSFTSCKETVVNCDEIFFLDTEIVEYNGKPFTGKCLVKKDSITIEIRSYKKGERSGKWVHFFDNGKINYEGKYRNNELNGSYKSYYESGQLKAEGEFNEGFYQGPWNFYNSDGSLKEQKVYKVKER